MSGVFISYRREDSAAWTGRIYDRACAQFGTDHVFLDVETIGPGEDFARTIQETLDEVDFVVAVIGSGWLAATDTDGRSRLDDPSDYVRREIAAALQRDARVVPVLVGGARMPGSGDLPEEIAGLSTRNAVAVSDTRFDRDIERLLDTLGRVPEMPPAKEIPPHNLPSQHTPFVGRTEEIKTTKRLLKHKRLVSLLGPGGSGKTRLALQVASDFVYRYEDGVWFIDFRQVDDPAEASSLVATTMRIERTGRGPLTDQLVEALWSRRLLLILDNCEHVLDEVAPFVERVLSRDGDIRILATSREALGIPGESPMAVLPLPVPSSPDFDDLIESDAARLFIDRVHSARPDFALDHHVGAVFDICRAVEGLPLALELAASRVRAISPEEIAARLNNQLSMLRSSRKAGDLRHATLEGTIRWSWDLLDDAERALYGRLSLFRGSWALDAAEGICGFEPIDRDQILDLLGSLVDKSLVVVDQVSGASTRYRLLEPLRQFAARQVDDRAAEDLRSRSIDFWSSSLTESWDAPPHYAVDKHYEPAWALEPDQANLTAAVEWAFDSERYEDATMILGSSFGHLLMLQAAPFDVVYGWIETALAHRRSIPAGVLLSALEIISFIAAQESRDADGLKVATLAMELARTPEERLAWLESAAMATNRMGRHHEAGEMFDQVIAEADHVGLRAAAMIGKVEFEKKPKQAWALAQQAMGLSPLESMEYRTESYAAYVVGDAAAGIGRYGLAGEMARRSLDAARRTGYAAMSGFAAVLAARVNMLTGHLDDASQVIRKAESATRRILGSTNALLWVLLTSAEVERLQGEFERARRYVGEARRIAEQSDDEFALVAVAMRNALIERDESDLQGALGWLDEATDRKEKAGLTTYPMWAIISVRAGVELRLGQPEPALARLVDLLADHEDLPHSDVVEYLDMIGIALLQKGRAQAAACLTGAVDAERERTGLVCLPPDQPIRAAAIEQGRALLGDGWEAGVESGRAMTLDEAVAYALESAAT